MLTVRWADDAADFYDGLDAYGQGRVDASLFRLCADPTSALNAKRLTGPLSGLWSLRIGRWRLIYVFDTLAGYLDALVLADRRDAYD